MCTNQPEVGQYDLVALTKEEQRLLKTAPRIINLLTARLTVIRDELQVGQPANGNIKAWYSAMVTLANHAIKEATNV